jgi:hypothetical protein
MRSDIVPTAKVPELSDDPAGHQMHGAGIVSPCAKVRAAEVPTRSGSGGLAKWWLGEADVCSPIWNVCSAKRRHGRAAFPVVRLRSLRMRLLGAASETVV